MRKPGSIKPALLRATGSKSRGTSSLYRVSWFALLLLPASHVAQFNHLPLLSGLRKYLILQSLLFILTTLQARTHYLNFKASRLRLWACGISSRPQSECVVGSSESVPGALETLLPTWHQLQGKARTAGGVGGAGGEAGQVPQPSTCPPQPIPTPLLSLPSRPPALTICS